MPFVKKRKPGRPPKIPKVEIESSPEHELNPKVENVEIEEADEPKPPPKKRGRKPKSELVKEVEVPQPDDSNDKGIGGVYFSICFAHISSYI